MNREDQLLLDEAQIFCSPAVSSIRKAMGLAGDHTTEQRLEACMSAVMILLARLKKTDMALQSLTPGGSEYFANPELCVQRAMEVRDNYRTLWTEERDQRIDLERQLQNALPFNPGELT